MWLRRKKIPDAAIDILNSRRLSLDYGQEVRVLLCPLCDQVFSLFLFTWGPPTFSNLKRVCCYCGQYLTNGGYFKRAFIQWIHESHYEVWVPEDPKSSFDFLTNPEEWKEYP
jgi:hypothetical protein